MDAFQQPALTGMLVLPGQRTHRIELFVYSTIQVFLQTTRQLLHADHVYDAHLPACATTNEVYGSNNSDSCEAISFCVGLAL